MFVIKESKDKKKWGIYFVFCELNICVIWFDCSKINICSLDLQDITIYKTIKKNFTAIDNGYFKVRLQSFSEAATRGVL